MTKEFSAIAFALYTEATILDSISLIAFMAVKSVACSTKAPVFLKLEIVNITALAEKATTITIQIRMTCFEEFNFLSMSSPLLSVIIIFCHVLTEL